MRRPAHTALIAIGLVLPGVLWAAADDGLSPCPRSCERANAALDLRSIDLLREKGVQDRLGLSAGQKVEVGHRLALALDPDQEDLVRMILCQYHDDRDRLSYLENPDPDDDEPEAQEELAQVRRIAGGFPARSAAMLDRVLTPGQRAALGPRPSPPDPEATFADLMALQRACLSGVAAALTPGQREELNRLVLRAEGPLAAVRPEVAARLNLGRDQRDRIRAIWDAARADLDRLRGPDPVSPAYRDGDDLEIRMKPRLATIRNESARILSDAGEKIRQVLQKSPTDQGRLVP
jgi:hypothetical protein